MKKWRRIKRGKKKRRGGNKMVKRAEINRMGMEGGVNVGRFKRVMTG